MTSNIERIRAAETVIPQLQDQLKTLREEALADDGQVDAEERVDIDRVADKLSSVMQAVATALQDWTANKAAYDVLRSGLETRIKDVAANTLPDLDQDKRAIAQLVAGLDQVAGAEDYAAALELCHKLETYLDSFESEVESARLDAMPPEQLAAQDLTQCDLDTLFTEDYMTDLADTHFPGEGTEKLADLMTEIENGVSGERRAEVMAALSEIHEGSPTAGEFDADYTRFLVLRKQQDAIGDKNNCGDMEKLDEDKHPDFRGSRSQLMFGKVVGDAFDIHEIFAALLSPTGGLIGAGNQFVGDIDSPHWDAENPISLHGTVHDAAGYLKSFHEQGPGYNYRDNFFEGLATDAIECLPPDWQAELLPYTGQLSGGGYWIWETGGEFTQAKLDEVALALEEGLTDARDDAAKEAARMLGEVEKAKQEMIKTADQARKDAEAGLDQARREVETRVQQAERDLRDLADQAEAEVMGACDAAQQAAESVGRSAVEQYEEAAAEFENMTQDACDTLDAIADFIWS
ncbi:hypothetical protein Z945_2118 [Sulfitobacter noctilucae]|uniref:hypothetical protein n=1 Tax=Sulfitobacter noctilucae TaxID=1342302 RepID=UPI00046A6882|nr:hypothetical protein [Sulfitobacter noctilucae]KIN61133.1 hypothetical protein Z945_2118 [Sulfitobacter noctilucae]